MYRILSVIFLLLSSSLSNSSDISEKDLFWVELGKKAPDSLTSGTTTNAPYLNLIVPTRVESLSEIFPNISIFLFLENKLVVGIRGERVFSAIIECENAKERLQKILSKIYPDRYEGDEITFQYLSKDKKIKAGVLCSHVEPFPRLSMVVSDIDLERELTKKLQEKYGSD